jgi:hypothetical protein
MLISLWSLWNLHSLWKVPLELTFPLEGHFGTYNPCGRSLWNLHSLWKVPLELIFPVKVPLELAFPVEGPFGTYISCGAVTHLGRGTGVQPVPAGGREAQPDDVPGGGDAVP